jgi:hypothetical protein
MNLHASRNRRSPPARLWVARLCSALAPLALTFTHIFCWTPAVNLRTLPRSGLRRALYQGTASAVPQEALFLNWALAPDGPLPSPPLGEREARSAG